MPQYAPGYLLFRREATVFAQPFDAGRLALSGGPVQVAGEVGFNATNGRGHSTSPKNGTLIYFQAPSGSWSGRARGHKPTGSSAGTIAPADCWPSRANRDRTATWTRLPMRS